jgi:NAD(P)-dependent dehydrogenase (short-subunit alcohol dehydrogenase family)
MKQMGARLSGKVVVVTGATQGIGKGIACMCAAEGAKVTISGLNHKDGQRVVQEIQELYGVEALFVKGDLTREEACMQVIDQTVSQFGRIDGLVNNAGIYPRSGVTDTTEEMFDSVFALNIKAPFFLCKYAVPAMMSNVGGSIVNIGSMHGYRGGKELAAYACSKGALLTLSRHLASNYANQQIRSNWVTVGWVASEGETELHQSMGKNTDQLYDSAKTIIPSGRMQTAEDNAYGVIYLLSDEASQVTGTELFITGGMTV